jgi:hypothetical protein
MLNLFNVTLLGFMITTRVILVYILDMIELLFPIGLNKYDIQRILMVKCLYAMVHKIRYSPIANIVNYFKEICTLEGPIECTSMVTRICI